MNKKTDQKLESSYVLKKTKELLRSQTKLLAKTFIDNIPSSINAKNKTESLKRDIAICLCFSIYDSCSTVILISNKNKLRDCLILSRAIFETTVNLAFIFAKGEEAIHKADRHARQKMYRDFYREIKLKDGKFIIKYLGKDHYKNLDEFSVALKEYTTKKGNEITKWTPESIIERVDIVSDKFDEPIRRNLNFALYSIYRHASEITHGTFFGGLFVFGRTDPSGNLKDTNKLLEFNRNYTILLLVMLSGCINTCLHVLSKEFDLNNEVNESDKLMKKLKKYF